LTRWLESRGPAQVGEAEWEELRREFAPISAGYLRKLLRESGVRLHAMVEGVRQESLEALESSLLRLLEEYEGRNAAGRAAVRRLVIEAKDHARWAARKPERRAEKEEMALWMLMWLQNPPLFPQWVRLRKQARSENRA
jgi:hypothetical protein